MEFGYVEQIMYAHIFPSLRCQLELACTMPKIEGGRRKERIEIGIWESRAQRKKEMERNRNIRLFSMGGKKVSSFIAMAYNVSDRHMKKKP